MSTSVKKYDDKYINRFCQKYIWFSSLTGDLVFWAIVDTLFVTIVKGLSATQITLLTTIPSAIGILIQPYLLKLIHKIGNTASVRLGALSLLISAILLTFGNTFSMLVFGRLFHEIAFVVKNMEGIMLKNNLIYVGREEEYVHIRNQSSIAYAVITAVIAFGTGYLFNVNHYLPMILNILLCLGCLFLSLTMKDITKNDKISEVEIAQTSGKMSMVVYIAILSYAFFYTAINLGQSNSKLFIQYELGNYFDEALTASYFSMIILLSRISRIISNVLFDKMYRKLKDRINIALCGGLILAFGLIIFGNFIKGDVVLKIGTMACGFFLILAVRDPFKIYIQDLILRVTEPEEQQAIFAHLELARKIGQTLIGFVVSVALLRVDMIWVIVGIAMIALMTLKTTIRLFEVVQRTHKDFGKTTKSVHAVRYFLKNSKKHLHSKQF